MKQKTYGVSGLMDWTTQIKAGKGTVSVHFIGGALTAYGVTPAKYSTSNPFFQKVIEDSEPYKSGRIQLLGEMEVAGGSEKTDLTDSPDNPEVTPRTEKVAVADKNEAVEWLKEHFGAKGYTSTSLRSKAAFDAACKECGVVFEWE